jgi:hypothetical protein
MNLYIFLQFSIGQKAWLLNPKCSTQKVAIGTISSVGRDHKFHFRKILEKWFKVDVLEALHQETALMYPNEDADQKFV